MQIIGFRPAGRVVAALLVLTLLILGTAAAARGGEAKDQLDKACLLAVKAALKSMALAQEVYYLEHGEYTADIQALIDSGAFLPDPNITYRILKVNKSDWSAGARHGKCEVSVVYHSATGRFEPE